MPVPASFAVYAVMNVNGFEAMMILVVALIVLGPDRLPEAARKAGNFINQMKRMSDSFQQEIRDAVDLPDLDMPDLDTLMKPKSAIMKSVLAPPTVVAGTKAADAAAEESEASADDEVEVEDEDEDEDESGSVDDADEVVGESAEDAPDAIEPAADTDPPDRAL